MSETVPAESADLLVWAEANGKHGMFRRAIDVRRRREDSDRHKGDGLDDQGGIGVKTQEHDWTAWLGPAAEELTDEQRMRFETEARIAIDRIGDDPDLQAERDIALSAIVQYLLSEATLDDAGNSDGLRVRPTGGRCWSRRHWLGSPSWTACRRQRWRAVSGWTGWRCGSCWASGD